MRSTYRTGCVMWATRFARNLGRLGDAAVRRHADHRRTAVGGFRCLAAPAQAARPPRASAACGTGKARARAAPGTIRLGPAPPVPPAPLRAAHDDLVGRIVIGHVNRFAGSCRSSLRPRAARPGRPASRRVRWGWLRSHRSAAGDPQGLLEVPRAGRHQGHVLAIAVAGHHVGSNAAVSQGGQHDGVGQQHGRLREEDVGAQLAAFFPGDLGEGRDSLRAA